MYKNFLNDTWREFNALMKKNKPVWIWGAGHRGKEIIDLVNNLELKWNIKGFIDSNEEVEAYEGYKVIHVNDLHIVNPKDVVLISIDMPGKVAGILEEASISNYFSYYWLNEKRRNVCYQQIEDEKVDTVLNYLSDEKSKNVFKSLVEKRKMGFVDYSDIKDMGSEYFSHNCFEISNNEIFVDCGGFDGDTIKELIEKTGCHYKKIYTFEPDDRMFKKIEMLANRYDNIDCFKLGLSDKKEAVKFIVDNSVYSSHIYDEKLPVECDEIGEETVVNCDSLDNVIGNDDVTFIKMDIEGAEIKALMGAEKIIKRNKPKLAISIYHKPDDLWEIPMLIHALVPEYKMYIRHYNIKYYSTVLFCTL